MTVKVEQLEQFIEKLVCDTKRIKINKTDLDANLARNFGCSKYTINSRFEMLLILGLIELDTQNTATGVYILNTKKLRDLKKEKEAAEEKENQKKMDAMVNSNTQQKEKKK